MDISCNVDNSIGTCIQQNVRLGGDSGIQWHPAEIDHLDTELLHVF